MKCTLEILKLFIAGKSVSREECYWRIYLKAILVFNSDEMEEKGEKSCWGEFNKEL